jgi:pyruvate carboxylase
MLLRGRNTVGYTPYPSWSPRRSCEEATATGVDIFRIFDALNNVSRCARRSTRYAKQALR